MGIQEFINNYLGEYSVGNTSQNKGQCVGLVAVWADNIGAPHDWGNAKDLLNNADQNFYDVIYNAPDNFPILGDIIVWDYHYGNGNGHTAIVLAANTYHLGTFDQNWTPGGSCQLVNHDYEYALGWLHPKHGI